jgi:hypothetical protein
MLLPIKVLYWAEGPTDRAVAVALIAHAGAEPGPDYSARQKSASGKQRLDQKLPAYNAAAAHEPFLVLRDLDRDAECAPSLLRQWDQAAAEFMCFRIVVRALEAWLMADARALANWLQVKEARIPIAPEELANPKEAFLALVQRSTSREIKSDLLPSQRSGRQTGPLYAPRLQEFIDKLWDIRRVVASGRAPSLTKAVSCLERVVSGYKHAHRLA